MKQWRGEQAKAWLLAVADAAAGPNNSNGSDSDAMATNSGEGGAGGHAAPSPAEHRAAAEVIAAYLDDMVAQDQSKATNSQQQSLSVKRPAHSIAGKRKYPDAAAKHVFGTTTAANRDKLSLLQARRAALGSADGGASGSVSRADSNSTSSVSSQADVVDEIRTQGQHLGEPLANTMRPCDHDTM